METVTLDTTLISVFLLVLCRLGGWVLVTPLLGSRSMTISGRIALSVSLALVLTAPAAVNADVPTSMGLFIQAAIVQFLFGAGFGFLSGMFIYAVGTAGAIADAMSGLGYASIVDPGSGQQAAVFSRLFSITFIALLFATNGYITIINGLAQTFQTIPIAPTVPFDVNGAGAVAEGVTQLMAAAIQVGAPMLGVLLLTEVALAVAARFFPQANVAFLGLGLKALVALLAASAVLILLPSHIDELLTMGSDLAGQVFN